MSDYENKRQTNAEKAGLGDLCCQASAHTAKNLLDARFKGKTTTTTKKNVSGDSPAAQLDRITEKEGKTCIYMMLGRHFQ